MVRGQDVRLEGFFRDFVTFYVSSVDVSSGATDVELFDYTLKSTSYPVEVSVEFKVLINSVPLNHDYNTPFLEVWTKSFTLNTDVRIRNTDLNASTDHLVDVDGRAVYVTVDTKTIFDEGTGYDIDKMQSLIIQSGRLPDGIYRFEVTVNNLTNPAQGPYVKEETIVSAHPIALELISPGGPLDDIENNMIATIYPFFQWESDPCAICTYRIRVAKFKCEEHSSAEDAIEDQTVLPISQADVFYDAGNATSFQYPQTGAVELEPGNIYVWQIQKVIPTTEGDEAINSFIYAFMIAEQESMDRIKSALRDMLGEEEYQRLFGICGDLMGFAGDEDGIVINGERIDVNSLEELARLISQGELSISNSEVQ